MLVASPGGESGSLKVHQDAFAYLLRLDEGESVRHAIGPARGCWLQITRGIAALDGTEMREGDGAAIEEQDVISISAETYMEALLFDLA